jgi:hypothetical protein
MARGSAYEILNRPIYSYANGFGSPWIPVNEFNRTDGDVSVYFLAQNSVAYLAPVFDPFFSANGTARPIDLGLSRNLAKPDHLVNVLGCVDQYQVCNPVTSACSSLGGLYHLAVNLIQNTTLGLNKAQQVSAGRLQYASLSSKTYDSVEGLGASGKLSDITYCRHIMCLLIFTKPS